MRRYMSGNDRNQLALQPMCLDELIPENCEVRALDAIVENMGIPTMGFVHAETKETGRKPYDPVDLFKLYVYSYFNGIRSSRKIERECHRNMEVMWLVNGLRPDFKPIADFRKGNKKAIKQAFRGYSYFLTRRTASVRVESLLHFLTYNMKRAIHIVGVQELVLKMQE